MKKALLVFLTVCLATMLQAAVSKTVNLTTAGTLSTVLAATDLSTITDLTLSGNIDARDFKTMRDSMKVLANIDMSGASIAAYEGILGSFSDGINHVYLADVVPDYSFRDYKGIYSKNLGDVKLPSAATSIGICAFKSSTLSTVSLPNTLINIGASAFEDCSKLASISIPNTVKFIGANAFNSCAILTQVVVPDLVTTIESFSFSNCQKLTSIVLPKSIKTIKSSAFLNSTVLKSISIPDSVTSIGERAFFYCRGVQTITIPSTVTSIEEDAFAYSGLKLIIVKNPTPIALFSSISDSYDIQLCVPKGSKSAYKSKSRWGDYKNIIEIDENTINSTPGQLSDLVSKNLSATSIQVIGLIDARDFKTMRDLMPNLASVDLSGATIVEYTGTEGTAGTTSLTYPANTIPYTAFADPEFGPGKPSLTSIVFPATATAVASGAFYKCANLKDIQLSPVSTSIANNVFYACSSVKSIVIPKSVNSIGARLLDGSTLNYIRSLNPVPPTCSTVSGYGTFHSIATTTPLYVPIGSKSAYAAAAQWKDFSNIIEISCNASTPTILANTANSTTTASVTANTDWTASTTSNWLQISPVATTNGNGTITYTAINDNPTLTERSATVTIIADGVPMQTITVTQAAADPQVSIENKNITMPKSMSLSSAKITSNTGWTVVSNQTWLTVSPASGSNNGTISLTATANTGAARTATLTVSATGVTEQTITVTQESGLPTLSLSKNVASLSANTSSATANVTSNTTWTATSNQTWLTLSPASSNDNGTITFTATANTGAARTAMVTVAATGVTEQTITVTQAAGTTDAPETSASSIAVYPNPTAVYFTISNSTPATVEVYTQAGALLVSTTATSKDQIMLDAFAAGTYIVKVTTSAGVTEHTLIKQ